MSMKKVLVGVPTYSGASTLLPWCLQAIRQRTPDETPFDLFVVDDSGKPDHARRAAETCARFDTNLIVHSGNRGVAAGWNTLARAGAHEYVILLNDDFIVSPGWVDTMVYFLEQNPSAGSAGYFAFFITQDDVPQLLTGPDARVTPRDPFTKVPKPAEFTQRDGSDMPGRCMAPPGCGFGFRRSMFDAVGGFDERYKSFYEEADWGTSCAKLGYPAYALQWPFCYHIWSATFGQSPELKASARMASSRAAYIQKWGTHTEEAHAKFMSAIPFHHTKWLDANGPQEAVITAEHGFYK